ncbi:uncharacterized protein LOC115256247 [Aedes albopictus]|uniref:Uncharacterized protein n=1 Tax=Aedes albopictus TaxID=7160 RepID=A0ABM1YWC9_AEDAL|nr:predicted GPI-anchored protein 58 [Aedes albopictus]
MSKTTDVPSMAPVYSLASAHKSTVTGLFPSVLSSGPSGAAPYQLASIPENSSEKQTFSQLFPGSVSAPPPPAVVRAPPMSMIPHPAAPSQQFSHHQGNLASTLSAPIPPPVFQVAPILPSVSAPYHLPTYPVVPSMLQTAHASAPAPALGPVSATSPVIASTPASSLVPPSAPAAQPASLV